MPLRSGSGIRQISRQSPASTRTPVRVCYPELLVSDLKSLEERIEALERKKGRSWLDKREVLDVLVKALLPVTIAFSAHHFSQVVGRAHIASAERLKERDIAS